MPKIGKRILKSSLAVFLCFMVYLLRGEQGIVFYSCIAAVLCVQQSTSNTIKVAKNRVEGTLIGGFAGMLVLLFEKSFIPHDLIIIQYILISAMIIVIIYITVVLKKTSASYISCVVFMSVAVSHAADVNPYMFAIDRIIDTLIGIFIALGLNAFHLPRKMEKDTLYYIDYDTLCRDGKMDAYALIKLRQLLERNAHIGLLSDETCGVFMKDIQSIVPLFPILCLRGAFLYDTATQMYLQVHSMPHETYEKVIDFLKVYQAETFVYSIIHDILHVYYGELKGTPSQQFYEDVRRQPYENYVYGQLPQGKHVAAIMVIEQKEYIASLYRLLMQQPFVYQLHIYTKTYLRNEHYAQLFITAQADELLPLKQLMEHHHLTRLRVISNHEDPLLSNMADSYDILNGNDVVKKIQSYYYHPTK